MTSHLCDVVMNTVPCLEQGNVLKTALAWIPVEGHCRKGCNKLQFQIIVSDTQTEGKSGENLCRHLCCVITTTEGGDSCSSSPYNVLLVLVAVPALQLVLGILLCLFVFFSQKVLTFGITAR